MMGDDWSDWANYIRLTLDRIERDNEIFKTDVYIQLKAIAVEIAIIKARSASIGAIAGAIFGIIASIVAALIIKGITGSI